MLSRVHQGLSYAGRAGQRLRSRGFADTAAYSFAVAQNYLLGAYIDLRYGRKLSVDRLHLNRGRQDCFALMHSSYFTLREIFRLEPIKPDDVLVEVGCGDGRVLNYWLSLGLQNKIIGVEIDEPTALNTARRLSRFPNVSITSGDISVSPPDGTVFYLYNPFGGEVLKRFEKAMRGRRAKIIIYNYTDISAFSDWNIRHLVSTQDENQYRAAVIEPKS